MSTWCLTKACNHDGNAVKCQLERILVKQLVFVCRKSRPFVTGVDSTLHTVESNHQSTFCKRKKNRKERTKKKKTTATAQKQHTARYATFHKIIILSNFISCFAAKHIRRRAVFFLLQLLSQQVNGNKLFFDVIIKSSGENWIYFVSVCSNILSPPLPRRKINGTPKSNGFASCSLSDFSSFFSLAAHRKKTEWEKCIEKGQRRKIGAKRRKTRCNGKKRKVCCGTEIKQIMLWMKFPLFNFYAAAFRWNRWASTRARRRKNCGQNENKDVLRKWIKVRMEWIFMEKKREKQKVGKQFLFCSTLIGRGGSGGSGRGTLCQPFRNVVWRGSLWVLMFSLHLDFVYFFRCFLSYFVLMRANSQRNDNNNSRKTNNGKHNTAKRNERSRSRKKQQPNKL